VAPNLKVSEHVQKGKTTGVCHKNKYVPVILVVAAIKGVTHTRKNVSVSLVTL
jgi:hypothetical protein